MVKFHQTFAKIYCLILPIFFLRETSFPKSIYKVPAKDADTHSEARRTTKMELFGEIFNLTVEYFPNFFFIYNDLSFEFLLPLYTVQIDIQENTLFRLLPGAE